MARTNAAKVLETFARASADGVRAREAGDTRTVPATYASDATMRAAWLVGWDTANRITRGTPRDARDIPWCGFDKVLDSLTKRK